MTEAVATPATVRSLDSGPLGAELADCPFPELLRSSRVRAGLTQRALADLSTVSPRTIRDIEAGRTNARTQTIQLLADALRLQGLMRDLFVRAGLRSRRPGPLGADVSLAVPKRVNALLGRNTEVRAMADALASGRRRMISISGLPGVGKTRLAAEIAAGLNARCGWPVLWIGTGARVAGAAGGPGLRSLHALVDVGPDGVAQIRQLVGRREALLVLDGVADVRVPSGVEELLAYCPAIRVISTSRAPWHVPGVQAAVIPPLATPNPEGEDGTSLDTLAGVPSVRLLVDRLAEVRPGFALTPASASAAAHLCRRLDGLPLAIEAMAVRFRVLGLRELAEMPTADLLDIVVPDRPGGAPETIGGLIESSVERLDVARRAVLLELAGVDRAWTVADVAAMLCRPLDQVVDDLNVLIGHGLVRAAHGEQATDLRLPNLLRTLLLRRGAP